MSRIISAVFVLTHLAAPSHASEVQTLLKRADAYRLSPGAMQVQTKIEVYKSGRLDKERQYLVYIKSNRRSLVISKSPIEKGQKLLMLEDEFWIILPSTQRPIRIAPAQKLLGEASSGDIATMTWAEDYDGVAVKDVETNGAPCVLLNLRAQRKGVTYQRIELYLSKADARPVQADLYVASDKLAKRATFTFEEIKGRLQVSSMTLRDEIQPGHQTVIRYLATSPRTIPDEYYNPMFLTRNDLKE
jgi:hypothetical protein